MSDQEYRSKVTPKPQPISSVNYPRKPGEKLPNGAIILAETEIRTHNVYLDEDEVRQYSTRRDSIVLCLDPGAAQPFVSWLRTIGEGQVATGGWNVVDYCSYGHYHQSLIDAIERYALRVEERLDDVYNGIEPDGDTEPQYGMPEAEAMGEHDRRL